MQLVTNGKIIPINPKATLRAVISKGLKPNVQVADLSKVQLKRVGDALLIEDGVNKAKLEIPNLWQACTSEADCSVNITSSAQPGQSITITPNSLANLSPINGNSSGNLADGSSFSLGNSIATGINSSIAEPSTAPTNAAAIKGISSASSKAASAPNYWLYALGGLAGAGAIGAAAGGSSKSSGPVNTPATIGGDDLGVTFEGSSSAVTGQLTVNDPDPNQSQFQSLNKQVQTYGTFSITTNGSWTYQVNNNNPTVANLALGQALTNTITVRSTDGTAKTITITIAGAAAQTTAFVENQNTEIPVFVFTNSNISNWVLSGADAHLFNVDSTGRVFINAGVVLDFENPIDAGQNNTFNLRLTGTGTGLPVDLNLTPSIMDISEQPSWLSNNNTYVGRANANDLTSEQSGIASLLSNDSDPASWHAKINGVRPVGSGIDLTYAFQNFGSPFDAIRVGNIDGSFSNRAKISIRSIFDHFATFTNIEFSETNSQSDSNNPADIRLFSGSGATIGVGERTLAYAYQPSSNNPKTTEYEGNVYFNNTSDIAANNPDLFASPFSNEQQTLTHEIGHALGLDHPFMEGADAGFSGFFGTTLAPNKFGVLTGGGHDSPLTDSPLETVMTYRDLFSYGQGYVEITETPVLPWKAGVYDMAALQHLYGANLSHNNSLNNPNTVYNYYSDQAVYDTIWDGGGIDTIVQNGNRDAVIDLRGGSEFSRVGYFSPLKIEFNLNNIAGQNSNSVVTFSDPTTLYTNNNGVITAYLPMPLDNSPINIDISSTFITTNFNYSFIDIQEEEKYNLGIGFGVTIENATGGGGNDQLIGNNAPNVLNGGAGNDELWASGGADTYIGGSGFDGLLIFNAAEIAFDTWTDFDIAFDKVFIDSTANLTIANLQWTPDSNTLRITEGSSTYDMVIQTNGAFSINQHVQFI